MLVFSRYPTVSIVGSVYLQSRVKIKFVCLLLTLSVIILARYELRYTNGNGLFERNISRKLFKNNMKKCRIHTDITVEDWINVKMNAVIMVG